jgi:hypothetical protein
MNILGRVDVLYEKSSKTDAEFKTCGLERFVEEGRDACPRI